MMRDKIQGVHLNRRAYVYVRQSTATQVFANTESTARQYALVERARALGWPEDAVDVIDEDLGRSGTSADDRNGFRRLAEAVAHGKAGAIFTLEVSRLARSSQDWQRLLALCGVAQVVVCDEHAIYDPREADDKLLLDFKGTMSEAELHWLRLRLNGAQRRKAQRGEMRFLAPTGYVWNGQRFEMDPDLAVRQAMGIIFDRFAAEPTANAVVRWAHREGFRVPTRHSFADGTSTLTWKPLGISRLKEILKSPIYAGAYAYGRRSEKKILVDGEIRTARQSQARHEWIALIEGAHEGYITWETYLSNLDKLADNAARRPSRGAPREGRALLSGLLICGRCGRRMRTIYPGKTGDLWTYKCSGEHDSGGRVCWMVSGQPIDRAVEDLLLRMIIPGELELSLAVEREVDAQAASLEAQWQLRLEQAEYEARRAERRYKAVDPDNRVVARTLESEWEGRLQELAEIRRRIENAKREHRVQLTNEDRRRIRALARDLPAVWRAATTTPADRKAMLRLVIEAVAIRPIDVPQRLTQIRVQWKTGAVDELTADRPGPADHNRTSIAAIQRTRELATLRLVDRVIAEKLNAEGMKSGSGRPWTANSVKHVRLEHRIARSTVVPRCRSRLPDRHPDGRYSMRGAMKRFGVSHRQILRWVECGMLQAVREDFEDHQSVWWVTIDADAAERIEQRKTTKRRSQDAEIPDDGDAL
jgi:DNA invertase Pin-like site-specific DNA recombinase